MKYEIVELEEKIVTGIRIRTINKDGRSIQDISMTWKKLFDKGIYNNIQNKLNHKTIGLYTEYDGDNTKPYTFIAGTEVSRKVKINGEIESIVIPKGKYAKFIIIGDVQNAVGRAWEEIWNMNIKRKYACDFEEYQNNSQDMKKQEIHIYIGLDE